MHFYINKKYIYILLHIFYSNTSGLPWLWSSWSSVFYRDVVLMIFCFLPRWSTNERNIFDRVIYTCCFLEQQLSVWYVRMFNDDFSSSLWPLQLFSLGKKSSLLAVVETHAVHCFLYIYWDNPQKKIVWICYGYIYFPERNLRPLPSWIYLMHPKFPHLLIFLLVAVHS